MIYSDEILLQVEKPARYIGRETGMVIKDPSAVDIRFAFCFPDSYEIGMSHLGLQILYYFFNRREDTYCERAFAPWPDMEKLMREHNLPLITLESYDPLTEFDFIGFTLQYEMCYTNVLNMLNLAKIPLYSSERGDEFPLICAGGPCAYNPEPIADFFDFFYIGEGEVVYDEIFDMYKEHKAAGGSKLDFLVKLLDVEGIYVPRFYDAEYNDDGTLRSFMPNHPNAKPVITKVVVTDVDKVYYPDQQLVPLIDTVHNRAAVEIFRGCIRGCRFCQAGYICRPAREKSPSTLICQAKQLVEMSGHEELSLVSLSTGDYTGFEPLTSGLIEEMPENVNINLPSLRIDAFNLELMDKVQGVRKTSLTFAPEAGSQRMRDVINKNISEDEILNGCKMAFQGGWDRVKLYFMIGLPLEDDEDLVGIAQLSEAIVDTYYTLPREQRGRPVQVSSSASCFVPKPFTPFQWSPQDSMESFERKQRLIKQSFTRKQVRFSYHNADVSVIEGVLARGDRRIAEVLHEVWRSGARFDSWNEHFSFERWQNAFAKAGLSIPFYTERQRSYEELLPWDHISIGVSKKFMIREMEQAKKSAITPDCRTQCLHCGAQCFEGGVYCK